MEIDVSKKIQDFLDGENSAFADIVNDNIDSVYSFVCHMTGDFDMSEDVTQEVFVKIWKNIKKYNSKQNFKSWIFVIARNTTIDWLRKKKNINFSSFEDEEGKNYFEENLSSDEMLSDEIFAKKENIILINKKIKELSPVYKEVLFLYYNEGLDLREISDVLKKPFNTVKSQYRRALLDLKSKISTKNL